MQETSHPARQYVLARDFDHTLSFHDTGLVLSELLGVAGFQVKVAGLSYLNSVQGGESWLTCCDTTRNIDVCAKRTCSRSANGLTQEPHRSIRPTARGGL